MNKSFGQSQRKIQLNIHLQEGKVHHSATTSTNNVTTTTAAPPHTSGVTTNDRYSQQQQTYCFGYTNSFHDGKFNKMTNPCFRFVSTGTCPLGGSCFFIHDPRLMLCVSEETAVQIYATMWQHLQHHHRHQQLKAQHQPQSDLVSDQGDTDGDSTSSSEGDECKHNHRKTYEVKHSNDDFMKETQKNDRTDHQQREVGFYFPRQLYRGPEAIGNQYFYTLKSKLQGNEHAVLVESLWMHFLSNFSTHGTIDQSAFFDERYPTNLVTQKPRLPIFQSLSSCSRR